MLTDCVLSASAVNSSKKGIIAFLNGTVILIPFQTTFETRQHNVSYEYVFCPIVRLVLTTLSQTASETNSGNSWGDLMSLAITPSASTSKILVLFNVNISTNTNNHVGIKAIRGSTDINAGNSGSGTRDCFTAIRHMSDDQYHVSNFAGQVLDSPSTTSATTYTAALKALSGTATFGENTSYSHLTLMEIAGWQML